MTVVVVALVLEVGQRPLVLALVRQLALVLAAESQERQQRAQQSLQLALVLEVERLVLAAESQEQQRLVRVLGQQEVAVVPPKEQPLVAAPVLVQEQARLPLGVVSVVVLLPPPVPAAQLLGRPPAAAAVQEFLCPLQELQFPQGLLHPVHRAVTRVTG